VTEPAFWEDVLAVLRGIGLAALQVGIIIVAALVIGAILRLVIRRVVDRIVSGAKNRARVDDTQALERSPIAQVRVVQRTRTLGSILQNILNVTIVVVALLLIISVINPNVLGSLTLLTAAVGAGLGFGAQNIVRDVLNGIFIVAEDQIGIGDVVDLGLATGIVEYVSVRITHVRDVNGTLWYVRNGEITRIGNLSQGWSRVIVDVGVPADSDLDEAEHALQDAANGLAKDPKWRSRIVERPEVWGLEAATGETLVLRVVMRTRAHAKDDVAKELRVRLKRVLDALGIAAPTIASVRLEGHDGAHRVRGANPPKTKPTPVPVPPERPVWRPKLRPKRVRDAAEKPAPADVPPTESASAPSDVDRTDTA
jgi:small conductance mechanosensitive channel